MLLLLSIPLLYFFFKIWYLNPARTASLSTVYVLFGVLETVVFVDCLHVDGQHGLDSPAGILCGWLGSKHQLTKLTNMDWNLFPFNLPLHLRILWYVFLLQLAIHIVYRYPPLSLCLELHVTTVPCRIVGARLTYSRDDILQIHPSPNLDLSLVENIRSCGIGVNLLVLTYWC